MYRIHRLKYTFIVVIMDFSAPANRAQDAWLTSLDHKALGAWIESKGERPVSASGAIDRSEILIAALTQAPVVWLTAPAGFGKTQIMSSVADKQSADRSIIWFTLDSLDAPMAVLLEHILEAAEQQLMGTATDALALLRQPDGAPHAEKILLLWLRDLAASGRNILIFMDDIHSLVDATSWQLLMALVRYLPDHVQLVLSGRYRPFAMGTAALQDSVFLTMSDLAFSACEQEQWLANQRLTTSLELRQHIEQRLLGWPVGLALWGSCFRMAGQPDSVNDQMAIAEMSDYLQGEVVCSLSPPLQSFLRQLSVLGHFNEALLRDVIGADYHPLLQQALAKELFIEPQIERQGWYRMHPVMAQCLASQLPLTERQDLHRLAYRWLSQRQDPVAALTHASQCGDNEEAARWVELEAESILANLNMNGLISWFSQLDEQILLASPRLMQIAAWTWLLAHQADRADQLIQRLTQEGSLADYEISALQGYLAVLLGQLNRADRLCRFALDNLPASRFSLRILMSSTLSHLSLSAKDPDGARVWNRLAQDLSRKFRAPTMEALAMFDHARIELNRGHISRSMSIVDQGLDLLGERPHEMDRLPRGRLLLYRGLLMWLSGKELDQLQAVIQQGIALSTQAHDVSVCYGYAVMAMQFTAQGRHTAALDALDEAERRMQNWQVEPGTYQWLHIVRANVWISQGKLKRAKDCIDPLLVGADSERIPRPELFPMLPGFTIATLSRLYLVAHQLEPCLEQTEHWLRNNADGLMTTFIRLIRAGALAMSQQQHESQRQFGVVRRTLEKEGVGLELHQWLPDLARLLQGPDPDKIAELSAQASLSDRELDVLRQMAMGFSNQEIADQLYISLHTVKTHARKINVKLGAKSRTQAIHRAKELMLL
ncbi:hypothetical protein AI19_01325 [Thalassolituus oleivorans 4BN06-13]|nr:hypothetical protein [Thalassolituus oleivorans 4BN06-13]